MIFSQTTRKRLWELGNTLFLKIDAFLTASFLLLTLISVKKECSVASFLYFAIFYLAQTVQHFLIIKLPQMDVALHELGMKRALRTIGCILGSYFFLAFMFWVKTDAHPFYCFLCSQLGLSPAIGIIFILHFIFVLMIYVQFMHEFISRKYFLLALGGFEVERRIIKQREENERRVGLIQPFYNEYPIENQVRMSNQDKFYKFQDIKEDAEGEEVCSICLMKEKEGCGPILTPCKHYFHRDCIENWAKINGKCPQCRSALEQLQPIQT